MISNDFAAELIAKMRANIETRDETTALVPADPMELLVIWLYDTLQQQQSATAFLNGGIKPVQRVEG